MASNHDFLLPDRGKFGADPFGYSTLAWTKWAMAQSFSGFPVDPEKPPTSSDLKSPVLWMLQAHALSEAAVTVIRAQPDLEQLPDIIKGACDSQYCAVGLMLVGYSLEVCLKAMLILRKGVDEYTTDERKHRHHNLVRLAEFIPDLDEKDKAILTNLTQFVVWAGRYPDPGSGRETDVERIFELADSHQIAGRDLFGLSTRIMQYAQTVVG